MTNFQGGIRRPVSREQVLFWSPVLLGGLLSIAAGGFLAFPALQQLQRHQQQLAELKDQEARLPLLRQQLSKQLENLDLAEQKQRQILQLIAGSGDISTFMAQLNQEASKSGVQLDSYEPVTTAAPDPAAAAKPDQNKENTEKKDPNAPPPPPPDPLLAPGLQKTTILITARGAGPQLQDFLRRLERLSLLVVQSDLSLKVEQVAQAGAAGASPRVIPALKLNVSLYSKASAPANGNATPEAPAKS
ncbi:MAG: hypothetical protein RLZZ423_1328 [Cyanobacteriota bacterium]